MHSSPSFQSTHPCGVRRTNGYNSFATYKVSIHAPLRGATRRVRQIPGALGVSIHAPLRGATCPPEESEFYCVSFNPRTPAGCDALPAELRQHVCEFQSTHPCGVRLLNGITTSVRSAKFQSTHPCGVRPTSGTLGRQRDCVSIHAPLRGATPRLQLKLGMPLGFNPRTPAGCDG